MCILSSYKNIYKTYRHKDVYLKQLHICITYFEHNQGEEIQF